MFEDMLSSVNLEYDSSSDDKEMLREIFGYDSSSDDDSLFKFEQRISCRNTPKLLCIQKVATLITDRQKKLQTHSNDEAKNWRSGTSRESQEVISWRSGTSKKNSSGSSWRNQKPLPDNDDDSSEENEFALDMSGSYVIESKQAKLKFTSLNQKLKSLKFAASYQDKTFYEDDDMSSPWEVLTELQFSLESVDFHVFYRTIKFEYSYELEGDDSRFFTSKCAVEVSDSDELTQPDYFDFPCFDYHHFRFQCLRMTKFSSLKSWINIPRLQI